MICPKCGFDNPSEASYCMNCGKRLDGKVMCPNCRSLVEPTETVCPKCKTKIPQDTTKELNEKDQKFIETRERRKPAFNIVLTAVFVALFFSSFGLVFGRIINAPVDPFSVDNRYFSSIYYLFLQWNEVRSLGGSDFEIWFLPIFRCVAVALNILFTFVFSGIGMYKGIRQLAKKRNCEFKVYNYAAVVLASNCAALALISSTYCDIDSLKREVVNGEIAKLIFFYIIFLLVAMIYKIYCTFDKNQRSLFVQKIIFMLAFISGMAIMTYLGDTFLVSSVNSSGLAKHAGISSFFVQLIDNVISYQTDIKIATLSLCALSVVLSLIMRILITFFIIYYINGFFSANERSVKFKLPAYVASILIFVTSILFLTSSLLTALLYKGDLLGYTMSNFDFVSIVKSDLHCSIGASVLSTISASSLMLGASMASFFIVRTYNKNMKIIEDKKTSK